MKRWKTVLCSFFALALATMFLGGCVVRTTPLHAHGAVYVGTDSGHHNPGRGHGNGRHDR